MYTEVFRAFKYINIGSKKLPTGTPKPEKDLNISYIVQFIYIGVSTTIPLILYNQR